MNIIKNRRTYIMISLAIMLVGLGMLFINGFNYGIDFSGGTLVQINANKQITKDDIKEITDKYDINASIIYGGTNKDEILIRSTLDLSNEDTTKIVSEFIEKFGIEKNSFQTQKFQPFMGKEIKDKAVLSIIIATIAMLVYITFRFQFRFGVAAVLALLHDVLITIAVYIIFKLPINSSFIAAILTIVGYSINSTIVIFDRVREELKLNPKESLENVINGSIKLSKRRTINTTITTILAVGVLYIVGVEDIKILALPLIIGMLAGTYSSIFIASPIWYDLMKIKTAK